MERSQPSASWTRSQNPGSHLPPPPPGPRAPRRGRCGAGLGRGPGDSAPSGLRPAAGARPRWYRPGGGGAVSHAGVTQLPVAREAAPGRQPRRLLTPRGTLFGAGVTHGGRAGGPAHARTCDPPGMPPAMRKGRERVPARAPRTRSPVHRRRGARAPPKVNRIAPRQSLATPRDPPRVPGHRGADAVHRYSRPPVTAKRWKRPKRPSADERINKRWRTRKTEYYSPTKKDGVLLPVTT